MSTSKEIKGFLDMCRWGWWEVTQLFIWAMVLHVFAWSCYGIYCGIRYLFS